MKLLTRVGLAVLAAGAMAVPAQAQNLTKERANILHILHDRAFSRRAAIGETQVELTLETSGRAEIEALKARLVGAGYRVEERTD